MKILALLLLMSSMFLYNGNGYKNTVNLDKNVLILHQNSTKIDEFTNYWYSDFRQVDTCDVTYEKFKEMYDKYSLLSSEEKVIVNDLDADSPSKGDGYKIIDVINVLVNKYNSPSNIKDSSKQKLDQTTMIWIVSGVAIFGISTILVFYILKNKEIIK